MERPRQRNREADTGSIPRTAYYRSSGRSSRSNSPFEKPHEAVPASRTWRRFVDVLFILGLLFILGRSLMLEPQPKVIASDTSYRPLAAYQAKAAAAMSGFADRNKVTFNDAAITDKLKESYPEIDTVMVELPVFGAKPVIRLSIAAPTFFVKEGQKDYLVDSAGRVVADRAAYPKIKNLPVIIDQSGYDVKPGMVVLGQPSVQFINQLIGQARKNHIVIQSLTLPPAAEELDLRTADKPYYVKFNLGGDAGLQSGQFLAARAEFARKNITPATYLDVRVSGKVFYK